MGAVRRVITKCVIFISFLLPAQMQTGELRWPVKVGRNSVRDN